MKFQGESFFRTPRDQVWAAIVDPETLLARLPGFQRLDPIGDHEYEGAFEVSIGEVRGDFQGTLKLADLKPPSSLRFILNAMGAAGFIDGDGLMVLEESGGDTRVHYDLDAKIGGRIAGVGEHALKESAGALARKALGGLGRRSNAPPPPTKFKVVTKQEVSTSVEQAPAEPGEQETRPAHPVAVGAAVGPLGTPDAPGEPRQPTGPIEPIEPVEPVELDSEREPATAPNAIPPAIDATTAFTETHDDPTSANASTMPPRQDQSGSRFSRDFTDPVLALLKRPQVLGVALVLYTLLVILMTRACS